MNSVILLSRTEKNATPWSKDKIKELLAGLKIENAESKFASP